MKPDARAHPEPIELSDYVDGELSWRRRHSVEAHLAVCPDCALDVASHRELLLQAAQLRTPLEPSGDLWPRISGRLAPRAADRPTGWVPWRAGTWPRLAAAGALAVALVLAVLLWPREQGTTTPGGTEIATAPAAVESEAPREAAGASAAAPAIATEQEYLETVAALEREARARLTFDPKVAEVLDENLASLNAAIANYREALLEEPGDERLQRRLVEAREHKIEVLEHALSLSSLETN